MTEDEEKQEAQAQALAGLFERVHWPQAIMFSVFVGSVIYAPIAFLTRVPEHIQDKVFSLPWTTIVSVGLPALGIAIHGFLSPFMRSLVAKKEPDAKSPSTGTVKASLTVTTVPHVSPPIEDRDPDPTPRGPFRGGAARDSRPTDPEDPETKP